MREELRLELLAVLARPEIHGELIAAAEIAGQETFGGSRLALLVLEPIRVCCTLWHTTSVTYRLGFSTAHLLFRTSWRGFLTQLLFSSKKNGVSSMQIPSYSVLLSSQKYQNALSMRTSDTQFSFFSKYVSSVFPLRGATTENCCPLSP